MLLDKTKRGEIKIWTDTEHYLEFVDAHDFVNNGNGTISFIHGIYDEEVAINLDKTFVITFIPFSKNE